MNNKGFTLIELIMVLVILSIFSFTFATFISEATDAWFFIKSRSTASGTARYALNRITSELRRINNPSQISTMNASECQFTSIDSSSVNFKQVGTNIQRNSDILASGAVNPNGLIFTYLDSAGGTTAVSSEVRSIRVRVSIFRNQETSVLESSARIRNL